MALRHGVEGGASSCTTRVGHMVESYVEAGIAPATRRAYRGDLDHFRAWGGDIPTTDAELAAYLAEHATTLKVATLVRRLAAISVAHEAQGLPNPVRSPLIRATMRGIRREHGSAQRQAKPLLRDDLFAVLAATGDSLKDIRDRALLLIGFAGGFRRSELVGLDCTDIERVRQGACHHLTPVEDRPGRHWPQDRHPARPVEMVPGRRARTLARSGGHRGRASVPAGRSPRPGLGRTIVGRGRLHGRAGARRRRRV